MFCDDLKEMFFGDWEGISMQQIYETSPELLANFWQQPSRFCPPNAENLHQFQSRILRGLNHLYIQMQTQGLQHALIVTHGGVIKLLRCLAQQKHPDELLKMEAQLGQLHHLCLAKDDQHLLIEEYC